MTYTKLDASQGPWSVRPSMQSVPESGLSGSQPGAGAPDQAVPASQGSAEACLPQSEIFRAATDNAAVEGAQAGSQPLQQAGASVSNACPGNGQEDVGLIQNSPWRVKRRKESSAPSSPEQVAKRAEQGLFASTPAGSSLGQRAAGQPDSLPALQDHMFSQEAAAASKSLMAALRAAGISPRSSDAPRSSDIHLASDNAAPVKSAAPSASLSTVHGAEPLPPGNAAGDRKSAASNSMSQPPGHGLRRASSREEAPMRSSSRSDEMDQDAEINAVGPPGIAVIPPAAGVGGLPGSARSAHNPSQPGTAGAPAGALPQPRQTKRAAAAQATRAPGMLSKQEHPNKVQRPVNTDARDLRAEERAAARLTTKGASPQTDQAVSRSRGSFAAAELSAPLMTNVPEQSNALLGQRASAAVAAGSQAAARAGAVHGVLSQTPVQPGRAGSAQDPGLPAVQATLVCTEVQAFPSTMVEALPPPQVAAATLTEAAAAPATHALEDHNLAGAPNSQHRNSGRASAGLDNSQPSQHQVMQARLFSEGCQPLFVLPMISMAKHIVGASSCCRHQIQVRVYYLEFRRLNVS